MIKANIKPARVTGAQSKTTDRRSPSLSLMDMEAPARQAANKSNESLSKWVRDAIAQRLARGL